MSRRRSGFTILEILVAIGLFSVLAAISLTAVTEWASNTRAKDAQQTGLDSIRTTLYSVANDIRTADYIYQDATVDIKVNLIGGQQGYHVATSSPRITYVTQKAPGSFSSNDLVFASLDGPSSASYVVYFVYQDALYRASYNWDNDGDGKHPGDTPFATWYKYNQNVQTAAATSLLSNWSNWPGFTQYGWNANNNGFPDAYGDVSQLDQGNGPDPNARKLLPVVNAEAGDAVFLIRNEDPASTLYMYSPSDVQITLDVPYLGTGVNQVGGVSLPQGQVPANGVDVTSVNNGLVKYQRLTTEVYAQNVALP